MKRKASSTVGELRQEIEKATGVPKDMQKLMLKGAGKLLPGPSTILVQHATLFKRCNSIVLEVYCRRRAPRPLLPASLQFVCARGATIAPSHELSAGIGRLEVRLYRNSIHAVDLHPAVLPQAC